MSKNDARKIASMLVEHERQLAGMRAKQLPFSAVTLEDGTAQGVVDGAVATRDALELAEVHDASLIDISDISDDAAVESTFLPERLALSAGGVDAAFDLGLITSARAAEAREVADAALAKAIEAGQTAAGFKRVRSATEPAAPEGGWERGDEWVLVHPDTHPNAELRGKAYEVRVWNGTAFVHAEYLADSLLIPSENGTIAIGDARIYAPEIIGGDVIGTTVSGSLFNLLGYKTDPLWSLIDGCESLTGWTATNGTRTLDTVTPHGGTRSLRLTPSGNAEATLRRSLVMTESMSLLGSVWVWSPSATRVSYSFAAAAMFSSQVEQDVPANTWTELQINVSKSDFYPERAWQSVAFTVAAGTTSYVKFDDLRLYSTLTDDRRLSITRDASGSPVVRATVSGIERYLLSGGGNGIDATLRMASADGREVSVLDPTRITVTSLRTNMPDPVRSYLAPGLLYMRSDGSYSQGPVDITGRGYTESATRGGFEISGGNSGGGPTSLLVDALAGDMLLTTSGVGLGNVIVAPRGKIMLNSPVHVKGDTVTSDRTLNVLWSGAPIYLRASQVATLSESVSKQLSGIILVWSEYANGAANNSGWVEYFVPKTLVAAHPGNGHTMGIRSAWGAECAKYAYVHDDRITGNDINQTAPNNTYVLRYVYGV